MLALLAHSFLHEQNPSQLRLRPARLQLQRFGVIGTKLFTDAAVIKLAVN
jgi:hypothetical protein